MDNVTVQKVIGLLSEERLRSLREHADSDHSAILLHQQLMQLGAACMTVIGVIEIALRNKVHHYFTDRYKTEGWMFDVPKELHAKNSTKYNIDRGISQAQRVAYQKLTKDERQSLKQALFPNREDRNMNESDVLIQCQKSLDIAPHEVITQLTFNFWKKLFSGASEKDLWDQGLKTLFPNKRLKRSMVATNLEVIHQVRNRIAHHELVYSDRLKEFRAAVDFISRNFMVSQPSGLTPLCIVLEHHIKCLDREM